jgi:pyruvate kinase
MDLAGPKLRVGCFENGQMNLAPNSRVTLDPNVRIGAQGMIPISYRSLAREIKVHDRVLLDDGAIRLVVEKTQGEQVLCRVETGGILKDHKGMNLPGLAVHLPAITVKDRRDLQFGLALGMDYVALSFVRKPEEMEQLRGLVKKAGSTAGIIAKIEKPQALPRLEGIILASDGIMVARGDLGVELLPEKVPVLQKSIISLANRHGRFVITATQMLQSMITSPSPTRAEATDVANAVFDGSDAVMLSGETAAGQYPREAGSMMARIAREAEGSQPLEDPAEVVVAAGVALAEKSGADALVVFTHTGHAARLASRHRSGVRVIALAHDPKIQRKLQLQWGVDTLLMKKQNSMEASVRALDSQLVKKGWLQPGDKIVICASSQARANANFLKIHILGAKD